MKQVNILFGPPKQEKERTIVSFFFSLEGKHIVCGGTTSNIVSHFLQTPLYVELHYERADVPPVGQLKGTDLVTEGLITLSRVRDMLLTGETPGKDSASQLLSALDEGDSIYFVCGVLTAEKKDLLGDIKRLLKERGKEVTVLFL